MGLVLSRREGEKIVIGDNIEITIVKVQEGAKKVSLDIKAPKDIPVEREEIWKLKQQES